MLNELITQFLERVELRNLTVILSILIGFMVGHILGLYFGDKQGYARCFRFIVEHKEHALKRLEPLWRLK